MFASASPLTTLLDHLEESWPVYIFALYATALGIKFAIKYPVLRPAALCFGLVIVPASVFLYAETPGLEVKYVWATFWTASVFLVSALVVSIVIWRVEQGRDDPVPAIQKTMFTGAATVVGALLIFALLGIDLSALFAGVAVSSVVIGLALQKSLGNLMSGLILDLDRSVRQGDWIQLEGDGLVGRVIDKSSRVTRLQTIDDEQVSVPNGQLANSRIHNLTRPDGKHMRKLRIGASYQDPPVRVKDVLRQILRTEPDVSSRPPPEVQVAEYGEFAVVYELRFRILQYREHRRIEDRILTKIWYEFDRHGITIPLPVRNVHHFDRQDREERRVRVDEAAVRIRAFLEEVPVLREHLGECELRILVDNAIEQTFVPDQTIVRQGERSDNLYFVRDGECRVVVPGERAPRIPRGEYFGEMALLVGHPRVAAVCAGEQGATLIRVDRESMTRVFETCPALREAIGRMRDLRKDDLRERGVGTTSVATPREKLTIAEWLVRLLREFVPW